jgi:putative nucleotidyltransferase with HDIG domain
MMTVPRWKTALEIAGTAGAFRLASDVAEHFSTAGISFLFLPSAVILGAVGAFRIPGVLGVMLGSALSPWGAAATWPGNLLFSVGVHGSTAVTVWLALRRPRGGTGWRLQRVFWWAGALANGVSALTGTLALALLGVLPWSVATLADNALTWWVSDAVAALVLGVPIVLVLRSEVLLAPADASRLREWMECPRGARLCVSLVLLAIVPILLSAQMGWRFPHWLAIFLVTPIALAGHQAGAGSALVANSLASTAFIATLMISASGPAEVRQLLAPAYTSVTFFTAFAFAGGWLAGRNRRLIEKVRAQEQLLRRDFERTVTALAAAIEAKDPTTEGHVQRVSQLTIAVAERLGLPPDEVATLRFGAILHDVGKIGVPERILNKQGALTADEKLEMERHVEIGLRIIRDVESLRPVEPLIRYHQERWDGQNSGVRYPGYFGLKGEEIPVGARILAAVDAFDAITNDRPYRHGRPARQALLEIEREAGRQFDPTVVAALAAIVREREPLPPEPLRAAG